MKEWKKWQQIFREKCHLASNQAQATLGPKRKIRELRRRALSVGFLSWLRVLSDLHYYPFSTSPSPSTATTPPPPRLVLWLLPQPIIFIYLFITISRLSLKSSRWLLGLLGPSCWQGGASPWQCAAALFTPSSSLEWNKSAGSCKFTPLLSNISLVIPPPQLSFKSIK